MEKILLVGLTSGAIETSHIEIVSFVILMLIGMNILCVWTYLTHQKRQITKRLSIDELTGFMSYQAFCEVGNKIIRESNDEYSLLFMDIDNFKYVNEIFGYEEGTRILQEFSMKLENYFKEAKAISRVGGDRFAIIVKREFVVDSIEKDKIKEYNQGINILDQISHDYYRIYISSGIYHIDTNNVDIPYCIDCADEARKKEKFIYGNTCSVYSKDMAKASKVKNEIVHSMEKGIENKEFTMLYQPKVDVKTNQIVGAEALVRWVSGYYNLIYPDHFIPVFERNGFILSLDYYVFERVCESVSKNQKMKNLKISINLSTITLLEGDVLKQLTKIMEKHSVCASDFDIEITETALIQDACKAVLKVDQLRQAGFSVSMDDFGTGMSGLSRFSEIAVDTLKIDKSFLDRASSSLKAKETLLAIISLAKKLNITTVVEGIEEQEQLDLIKEFDCDIYQGFLFSRPIPQEELIKLL
ncbi:putative bifunctional diguanylate cyclase/phosphodiesterase [Tannockella kyphosi]|uniref:putative bifunctional diguanylate cyclase/phosphodiesterase n=1 Tax=Tannockella kyphosi TaxID=2899121 RepID=UPI002012DC23|nr:bifunctional diguanylate cyclase/phosphodiesterase [Tannockella kyphosi]